MAKSRTESKIYIGERPADDVVGDCRVTVIDGEREYALPHCVHHSPSGFEWGYGGSGPADLALSMLQDYLDEPKTVRIYEGKVGERAWDLHHRFKFQMLVELGHERWRITGAQIETWLALQPVEVPRV